MDAFGQTGGRGLLIFDVKKWFSNDEFGRYLIVLCLKSIEGVDCNLAGERTWLENLVDWVLIFFQCGSIHLKINRSAFYLLTGIEFS